MNIGVRVGRHVDGTLMVLAAFCPDCDAEAMPHATGRCNWCGRMIVDERTLSAREMCKQIDGYKKVAAPGRNRVLGASACKAFGVGNEPGPGAASPRPVASLERLLADAGDLLDAIAVASVRGR